MLSSPMILDISSNMKDKYNNGIVPNFNKNKELLHPLPSFFQLTDHICWIFDDHEEHIDLVSQFCIDAVASNQAALVIFVDSEIQRALHQIFPQQKQQYNFLTEHEVVVKLSSIEGFNFQYYKDTEQIKFVTTRDTCFVDGVFSGEKLINLFKAYTHQATSQGYHGFRCCADMSFASLYAAGVEGREYAAFHYFESQLSLFIQEQPRFLKCCCYDRRICSPAFLQQVLMCHPIAAVGKEYLPYNFYFVPPHKSLGVVTANTVLDQWIDTLVTRKKLDRALEDKVVDLMAQVNALQAQVMENKRSVSTEELAELAAVQKSSFVASMSHELRTPLNGIATATALISTTPLTAEQLEYVEIIESSALHLQTVLRDVLDLCQMDSNKFEIDPIPVSIRRCLAHIKKMVNVSMNGAKRKEVVWEIADDVPEFICTDEHRLTQVLVNLISNSMKFTKHNGTIRISVTAINDRAPVSLRFQVCDDGVGIPKEVLESFFQHDYVRNSTTSLRFGGVGLGLTISKKLVEALGGSLSIESEGVDKGTVVTFTITESIPSSSLSSSSSSSSSSSPPSSPSSSSSPSTPPTLQQHEQRKSSFPTSSDSVPADSVTTALVPSYTTEQHVQIQGSEQLPPPLRWLEPSHSPPLHPVVASTIPQDTYMCTDDVVVVPPSRISAAEQQQQRANFLPTQLVISQNPMQHWQFSLDSPVFVVPDSAHPNSPTSTTPTTPYSSSSFAPINPSVSTELCASGMFHASTATSNSHVVCRSNSSSALIPLSSSTTSLLPNVLLPQPTASPSSTTPTTSASTSSSSTSSAPPGIVKTNLTSLSVSLTKTLKILLVEDNVMNQKVCKRLLNKLGYQPLIVSNGLEAVNAVRENIFDIILMDLHMPVMDGFEATRVIQSMPVPKKPKIFALTASVSIADVKRCKEVGMVAHISKPISVENLLKVLRMEW